MLDTHEPGPPRASSEAGVRTAMAGRMRVAGLCLLLILTGVYELTLGASAERAATLEQSAEHASWAARRYVARIPREPVPERAGRRRIAYLSNSHAMTGGRISRHLQALLDGTCPGTAEVVDLSRGGMFAPEFLQRFLSVADHDLDVLVLPVAYIAFSDRMPLARQALTARAMFHRDVFGKLTPAFWWRNYDFGLYTDALVSRWLASYRYRNRLRDRWEQPLLAALRDQIDAPGAVFLDIDEHQAWRFPGGYDRNLFQWSLYAGARQRHMADLAELVTAATEWRVPLVAANVPIIWSRGTLDADPADIEAYRRKLAEQFASAAVYRDYQAAFPVRFTAYDALHPTWHGARLHAFDLALTLRDARLLGCSPSDAQLLEALARSGAAAGSAHSAALQPPFVPLRGAGLSRLDPFDPAAARDMLRLSLTGSALAPERAELLETLARSLDFWRDADFAADLANTAWASGPRRRAFDAERAEARRRAEQVRARLGAAQAEVLAAIPVEFESAVVSATRSRTALPGTPVGVLTERRQLADGTQVDLHRLEGDEQLFSIAVVRPDRGFYERVDVFGDGSFAQVHIQPGTFHIPERLSARLRR